MAPKLVQGGGEADRIFVWVQEPLVSVMQAMELGQRPFAARGDRRKLVHEFPFLKDRYEKVLRRGVVGDSLPPCCIDRIYDDAEKEVRPA